MSNAGSSTQDPLQFGRELLDRLDKRFGPLQIVEDGVPSVLYHYTTGEGALGIISNHTLRFTDIRFLNDASEIRYGLEIATAVIDRLKAAQQNPVLLKYFEEFERRLAPDIVNWHVFCLCEKPNLLSQWRAYGGLSTSYCLGFSTAELVAGQEPLFGVLKCIYDRQDMEQRIEARFQEICAYIVESLACGEGDSWRLICEGVHAARVSIGIECIRFKHGGFCEEKEYRFVTADRPSFEKKFRAGRYGIVPYVELGVRGNGSLTRSKLPLVEVWIGPSVYEELAKEAIRALLDKCGYEGCELEQSKIPFRP